MGLGSNQGDKKANIKQAVTTLAALPDIKLLRVAPLYRTAPLGYTDQDWFCNTVAEMETSMPPLDLLEQLLVLENKMGRVRQERWGPRTIDLDLLLYGNVTMNSQKLTLPHPRMHNRAFVMVPLADLAPRLILPGYGSAADLAGRLQQEQVIEQACM